MRVCYCSVFDACWQTEAGKLPVRSPGGYTLNARGDELE
jgi:hypothetical protein